MKIYAFSAKLESAVIELLEDTTFLLPQRSNSDTPAYVKALRHLKAMRPSVSKSGGPVLESTILATK
jgi:hypothetical protein